MKRYLNPCLYPFYRTFAKVTVPLCFPAICEMWVYFFVNSLVTVSAVVFLYTPTAPITSVMIVSMQGAGQTAPAAAMCMLLLFINLIVRASVRGTAMRSEEEGKKGGGRITQTGLDIASPVC